TARLTIVPYTTLFRSAITVQLPHIRFEKKTTYENQSYKKEIRRDMPLLKESWLEAKLAVKQSNTLIENVIENLRDGVIMTIAILDRKSTRLNSSHVSI